MKLRLATLAGDPEREAELAADLNSLTGIELALRCVDRFEVLAAIRSREVDAIVSIGAPGWLDDQVVAEARSAGIRLIGVVDTSLEAERLRPLCAVVFEGATTPLQIEGACADAETSPPPLDRGPSPRLKGRIVSVWGPKGSPGRTTLACSLAQVLAATSGDTILVDADCYGGDVAQVMAVDEEIPTVVWASNRARGDGLGRAELDHALRRVGRKGPILLPGLPRGELWKEVPEDGWRSLLAVLATTFEHVICDMGFCLESEERLFVEAGGGRNRMTRLVLAESKRVVAVCRADPIGVKNFVWAYEDLRELVDEELVTIVLNRARLQDRKEISDLLVRHTGKRPAVVLPNRPGDFERALIAGETLVDARPGGDYASGVRDLAAILGGTVRPRGFLSRLAGATS